MNIRVLSIALPVALSACSEQGFHSVKGGGDGDGPAIAVTPDFIDYGIVGRDDDPVVESFLVQSVGATDLEISSVVIQGDAATSYTVLTEDLDGLILPPGAEVEVEVAFLPMGANDQLAQAIVSSNDESQPQLPVEMLGMGAVPELAIAATASAAITYDDDNPLDFEGTYVGCPAEDVAFLVNVGTDDLVITNIRFAGDAEFSLVEDYTLPLTLAPGESSMLSFAFTASDITVFEAGLMVTSNEPLGERTAAVIGEGRYAGDYTENWEIPSDPPSDILFAVDQSCSMDDDQSSLASNFGTFINELSDYSNDWQVMVVNDDNGCNNSGVLTPSMSGYESRFSSAVRSGGGNYTESLLTVSSNAIEATDSSECNSNFMRSDAMLHLILVSDEPEQSSWTSGNSWSTLVNNIIAKKGSSNYVRISAIAGPVPGGCGTADAGTGYAEAVAATGGVFLSICSNWSSASNLALLAEASINQDTFELSYTPVEDTIQVWVNGQARTTWTYDSAGNAVIFTERVPSEGDEVEISYSGLPTCD